MPTSNQTKNSLVVKNNNSKKKIIFNDINKYEKAVSNEKEHIEISKERIFNIEEELKKLKLLEKEMEKEAKKKAAKPKKPEIPVGQKHTIVSSDEFENEYNYDRRRKEWHQKAGHNEQQVVCSKCKDDDNWATVLLDNNKHICYYCWIKKPKNASTKKTTKNSLVVKKQPIKKIETKVDYEVIYPIELETLRTAYSVLPKHIQKEYEKQIYKMIDRLIDKKFIEKRH